MIIDILCLLTLVCFGLIGSRRGVLAATFGLLAVVLFVALALPVGAAVGDVIGRGGDGSSSSVVWLKLGAAFVVGAVLYVGLRACAASAGRALRRRPGARLTPALGSRYWGAALNVVKAALICWLVLCFFVTFPKAGPGVKALADKSWSVKTTGLFNPIAHWVQAEE